MWLNLADFIWCCMWTVSSSKSKENILYIHPSLFKYPSLWIKRYFLGRPVSDCMWGHQSTHAKVESQPPAFLLRYTGDEGDQSGSHWDQNHQWTRETTETHQYWEAFTARPGSKWSSEKSLTILSDDFWEDDKREEAEATYDHTGK